MPNLTEVLSIKYPIISAPMGGISGADLACAVTEAGGLGLIGGGYCDESWIKQQLERAKRNQFGIGFITWRLQQFPEVLTLALRYQPRAIMLSFGDISPFVDTIKNAGVPLICQVQDHYDKAARRNDFDVAGVFVGEGVGRIKEIIPVAQIMKIICTRAGL